jgi:beta-glucanase (GH16 family)
MIATLSPGDFPANPREKPGYCLEFHDEFSRPDLDRTKWLPFYLPQWSSRARAATNYYFQDDTLVLQITEDQQPWCPEFDGQNRCSSIQTGVFAGPAGSTVGQSRFNPACVVREEQENVRTYTPQYGYFELRAKGLNTPTNHVALWMIGYEDSPAKSAEIAIMEIMGKDVHAGASRIGYGLHPWGDPSIADEFYAEFLPIDATHYHIYAAEWTPTHIDFYVDNQKTRTILQSPTYEMQFMLGMYERPEQANGTELLDWSRSYPKRFTIDYFRAYQPVGGYHQM